MLTKNDVTYLAAGFLALSLVIIIPLELGGYASLSEVVLLFGYALFTISVSLLIVEVMIEAARRQLLARRAQPSLTEIQEKVGSHLNRIFRLLETIYGSALLGEAAELSQSKRQALGSSLDELGAQVLIPGLDRQSLEPLVQACTDPRGHLEQEVREAARIIPPERGESLTKAWHRVLGASGVLEIALQSAPESIQSLTVAAYLRELYEAWRELGLAASETGVGDVEGDPLTELGTQAADR